MEGKEWEELYCLYREMGKAAGSRKPSGSQKAKALWSMKAAWDLCSSSQRDIWGRRRTRLDLLDAHLEDPIVKIPTRDGIWFRRVSLPSFVLSMVCSIAGAKISEKCGKGPFGKASGLAWTHGTWCMCLHHPAVGLTR